MTGIYKITSPSGRVYIGQSWDIKVRWSSHSRDMRRKTHLSNSIKKYGWGNHKCEILHELPHDITQQILDNYEEFYCEIYKDAGFSLLNIRLGGKGGGKLAQYQIDRIIESNRLRKMNKNTRDALRKANIGRKMPENVSKIFAKLRPENGRITGLKNRGKVRTEENKRKISQTLLMKQDTRGEFHGKSKLTNEQVLSIRYEYLNNKTSSRKLGEKYNISKTNILDIIHRRTWRHI